MSEFLTVRLSRDNQSPVRWLVWSTSQNEIIASGELDNIQQLDQLSGYAKQRTTHLLLDSRDVLLLETEMPAGAGRQIDTMLPYLLEEDIAQDVDELHFSVLKKSGSQLQVAAVDRNYLTRSLEAFASAGLEVKKVIPDAQALPLEEGAVTALQIDDLWLFRKSQFQSLSVDEAWLQVFLDSDWFSSEEGKTTVTSYTEIPQISGDKVTWQAGEPDLVMKILAQGAVNTSSNLLTGQFKPQSSVLKNLRVWRKAAVAAVLFLIILTIQNFVEIQQREVQAKAYREESERIFRTIFPDKQRIPTVSYLKGQMTQEETRLAAGSTGNTVLSWMSQIPEALKGNTSIEIHNIRYDARRGEIRVDASMADFQTFEQVRTKLSEKFSVTQGSLDRKENKVSGSFVLRRK